MSLRDQDNGGQSSGNFLLNLLPGKKTKKTYESIVSQFKTVVIDLKELIDEKKDLIVTKSVEIKKKEDEISSLEADQKAAQEEIDKSNKTLGFLDNFLG